jgi:arylsulfatase A-like enzyme
VYFNSVGSPGQFRGRKRSLYEGGIRVPAVWRWPNVIPKNVTHRGVFGHVDFAPTVLALTGVAPRVPAAATSAWAGVDASAALRTGAPPPPRAVALKWEWRFAVLGPCWDAAPRLAARDPLHPELIALWEPNATAHGDTLRLELFNTTADPHEFANLASARPEDAARLQALLAAWLASLPAGPGVAQHPECGGSGAAGAPFARPLPAWAEKEAAEGYASARDALPRDAAGLLRAA